MCSEAEVEQMEEEKHDDSMGLEGEGEGKVRRVEEMEGMGEKTGNSTVKGGKEKREE